MYAEKRTHPEQHGIGKVGEKWGGLEKYTLVREKCKMLEKINTVVAHV